MKRLISVLMLCTLLLCMLPGCNDQDATSKDAHDPTSGTSTNAGTTTPTQANTPDELLKGTYKVPLKDIYVDTPDLKSFMEGYTQLFVDEDVKIITFGCHYTSVVEDLAGVYELSYQRFISSIENYHRINSTTISTEKTVSVNGIEAYNYEGVANVGRSQSYDAYIYGYAFFYEGFPCSIIGIVSGKEQPESEKQQVRQIIDEMLKTMRTAL